MSLTASITPRTPFLPAKIPTISIRTRRRCLQIRTRTRTRTRTRSSLDDAFKTLISLDLVPSALALSLASAASALFLSRARPVPEPYPKPAADWVLFTSPTPFNRSVLLRCPSVSFVDPDESERLLSEERHYVNVTRGCVPARDGREGGAGEVEGVGYQRVCVGTEDGGVVSLDWPESLDIGKEYGIDTTVLIVPGTAEGSADGDVRLFVADALRKGCFPIVMNPRGCAGSPLTTPRLFTAADSDDIRTAVQYISRFRPWATLMGVGWGYGANMLTKYLAEVGETTPLTAAVCIDNPFDLEEATRSFPHHSAMDQKLTGGLKEILGANKELFQGKAKGFALSKALSATSIRDFDGAISMISYGFDTIEDFYSMMSTRKLVNKVKIPVLFIQSDDGTVPLISVPRSTIAENPFTSLLICSCLPSSIKRPERSAILWCQQLAIEWLAAVELALLKGRHPLLKDVDITINPSKGFAYINEKASGKTISAGNRTHRSLDSAQWFLSRKNPNGDALMNLTQPSNVNGFLVDPLANVNKGSDGTVGSNVDSHSQSESGFPEMQKDTDSTNEGEVGSSDSEDGQVLPTASVVMNMLDVSMPGALDSEQKKKVLTAIEQGETLMKALQGAVPEEVRGKLTGAVTDILQTQGTKLNFGGLKRIGWAYNLMSEKKAKENPTTQSGNDVVHSSNQEKTGVGSDGKTEDGPSNVNSENNTIRESIESSQEKAAEASVYVEVGSEMGGKPSQPHNSEKGSSIIDENNAEKSKSSESNGETDKLSGDEHAAMNDGNDAHNNETKGVESLSDSTTPISASSSEESVSIGASASEYQVAEQEVNGALKNEASSSKDVADHNEQSPSNKSEEPLPQHPSNKPSINVTQALDALTGFDDSTQVAVNSVFGVLEDMIDQFEKVSNNKNSDGKDNAENQELVNGTEQVDGSNNKSDVESDISPTFEHPENSINNETVVSYEDGKRNLNKVNCSLTSSVNSCIDQVRKNVTVFKDSGNKNLNKIGHGQNFPVDLVGKEYWESPYAAFLQRYYSAHLPRMESLDSDSTTDLYHDPERGLWKMIDQEGSPSVESVENLRINGRGQSTHSSSEQSAVVNIVEPSYVILDNEYIRSEHQLAEEYDTEDAKQDDAKTEELICLIKCALLDALKIEVCRRLGVPDLKELKSSLVDDLQQVADEVSQAVLHDSKLNSFSEGNNDDPGKFGTIDGDHIVKTISSAVEDASHLRKVLPVGVIIGSSLASLRKYFQVVPPHDDEQSKAFHKPRYLKNSYGEESEVKEALSVDGTDLHVDSGKPTSQSCDGLQAVSSNNKSIMVGAVTAATAALGASALLAHHQEKEFHDVQNIEGSSGSANGKMFSQEGHTKLEEGVQEKNQNSVVSTLAEKAMSVAAPVVPTNSDGEVDQERLVAVLAELGQKGGMLRLVGKVALLWGGIRGAMSLTDKLISFLHIAERPLFQRVLGFVFMVLVLWSPIVIPLLPTFVQCWTTNSSIGVVKYACIIGLYAAITILIMLWGKRIRGYENPFEQYGLDLPSTSRVHDFLKGLIGGVMIVLCIHSINALLGYASFSLPFGLPLPSAGALTAVKAYGSLLLLAVRGTITATGIGMVEELLFRSWLTTEVAADHGYHNAILISAVAFSLTQRSLRSIPGFLLLSLALFGIKQRTQGKLYASIGLRSGIMTTNFLLQTGGFLSYWPATPFWVASTHPWHPFDGAIGVTTCAILAIFFYPPPPPARVPLPREKKI